MKNLMISLIGIIFLMMMLVVGYAEDSHIITDNNLPLLVSEKPIVLQRPNVERIKELKERIKERYDEMENRSWFEHKNTGGLDVYIGEFKDLNKIALRWRFATYGEDWVFFDKIIIKADDHKFAIDSIKSYDKRTDVWGGGICYESIDAAISVFDIDNATAIDNPFLSLDDLIIISSSDDVKIRFTGKSLRDWESSKCQINAFIDVLQYYLWISTDIGENYYK